MDWSADRGRAARDGQLDIAATGGVEGVGQQFTSEHSERQGVAVQVMQTALDLGDQGGSSPRLLQAATGVRIGRVLGLQRQHGRHHLQVVAHTVLDLAGQQVPALGQLPAALHLDLGPAALALHAVDEEDVDRDHEGIEGQGQPGRAVELEPRRTDEEPPGGQARQDGGQKAGAKARQIGDHHDRREEGQVGEARRKLVIQSHPDEEGDQPGGHGQAIGRDRVVDPSLWSQFDLP